MTLKTINRFAADVRDALDRREAAAYRAGRAAYWLSKALAALPPASAAREHYARMWVAMEDQEGAETRALVLLSDMLLKLGGPDALAEDDPGGGGGLILRRRAGPLIRTPPARADASRPSWRSDTGQTMGDVLGTVWLVLNALRLPPLDDPAAVHEAIDTGEFCGVYVPATPHRAAHFLVTAQAMTAFVGGHLGLECDTRSELHAALAELVDSGHIDRWVQVCTLPALGDVWCYQIWAGMVDPHLQRAVRAGRAAAGAPCGPGAAPVRGDVTSEAAS